jgi:hypothetical protein
MLLEMSNSKIHAIWTLSHAKELLVWDETKQSDLIDKDSILIDSEVRTGTTNVGEMF